MPRPSTPLYREESSDIVLLVVSGLGGRDLRQARGREDLPFDRGKHVRVFLIDDLDVVRRGAQTILEADPAVTICGEATSAYGRAAILERRPDIVILDPQVSQADVEGLVAACTEISAEIVVFTHDPDDAEILRSICAGVAGVVAKTSSSACLRDAVTAIASGLRYLDPQLTALLFSRLRDQREAFRDQKLARLSPREALILAGLADGKTNSEIAGTLGLAEKTVRNNVSTILHKLGVPRRTAAVRYFLERGSAEGWPTTRRSVAS